MGRKFYSLEDPGFGRFFDEFEFTAYRLETLQYYNAGDETEEYRRFLAGEQLRGFAGQNEWITEVAAGVAAGRIYQRVHVVTEPLTDYMRFECASYHHTVSAGDDVRILPVPEGTWPEGIPHRDYWLFDSRHLMEMHYTADGTFTSAEVIEDPEEVVLANHLRDRAVHMSVPFAEYAADRDASLRRP